MYSKRPITVRLTARKDGIFLTLNLIKMKTADKITLVIFFIIVVAILYTFFYLGMSFEDYNRG